MIRGAGVHRLHRGRPADRDTIRGPLAEIVAATRTEDGCEEYGCYDIAGTIDLGS